VKNGEKRAYRRVLNVNEIADFEKYIQPFKWDPLKDEQKMDLEGSVQFSSIAERLGVTVQDLIGEMNRRRDVLHWMREQKIRSYKDVANIIAEYYARPKPFYEKIMTGEEARTIVAAQDD
jgi:flagellar protein FlaI